MTLDVIEKDILNNKIPYNVWKNYVNEYLKILKDNDDFDYVYYGMLLVNAHVYNFKDVNEAINLKIELRNFIIEYKRNHSSKIK